MVSAMQSQSDNTMNDTPESDEVFGPRVTGVRARKCRDLERRLTIAREALTKILNSTMDPRRIEPLIEETLTLTAPKL